MGQLVFQATAGGQVALVGPNPASNFSINVPAINGTFVTTGDTGTVTNTMLASNVYTAPGTIGSVTPNTGAFTTLSASSTVSGAGFSTYLASPPAIGGTAAAAGSFTTLSGSTSVTTPIVKSASSLTLQTNGTTTAVTIDTSQNVGIGTSSPVSGANLTTLTVYNATQPALYLQNSTTGTTATDGLSIGMTGTDCYFNNRESGNIITYVNGSERMRIDSSGNLLVGTTSSIGGLLQVNQTANSSGANFQCTNASFTTQVMQAITTKAAGTDFTLFRGVVNNAGTVVYNVFGNGNVTNTNNSYGAISDIKLKENIVDATPKLDDLMKVKVRNYNLKSNPDQKQIGVVAQELEEVFAGLIDEIADTDIDGNNLGTTTKQVKYSVFVPMLIKAIQELNAKVDAQATIIETLQPKTGA